MDRKRQVFFRKILCHIFESEMSMVRLKLVCNFSKYQSWQFVTFLLKNIHQFDLIFSVNVYV